MKRAMAKQAEAERERRAAIIAADGEKASAQAVSEAANLLAKTPGGLQIRTLQTLEKISADTSQKTVIMLPGDFGEAVAKLTH
jgi:regulator of protease activity HflC (stomatin/prohibitin superfamily)